MSDILSKDQLREHLDATLDAEALALGRDEKYVDWFHVTLESPRILTSEYNDVFESWRRGNFDISLDPALYPFVPTAGRTYQLEPLDPESTSIPQGACSSAEYYHVGAKNQAKLMSAQGNQRKISVYHDGGGTPLFLRKQREDPNALLLQPATILNTPVPAGTIVWLGKYSDTKVTGEKTVVDPHDSYHTTEFRSIQFDVENDGVMPLRLSAFAFPDVKDRALFSLSREFKKSWFIRYDNRQYMLEATTIEAFQQAAANVLANCFEQS